MTGPSITRIATAMRPIIGGRKGFTLLEVLVATMVLGIAVVIVMQLFSGGLDQARRAQDYTRAVFHARAKMEEVLLEPPAGPVSERGEFSDGYRWALEALTDTDLMTDALGVQPVIVRVTIGWGFDQHPKTVYLQTMTLATVPEEPPS
jgi:general secretion pathway protein I